jgi:hypothetical protein
MIFTQLISEYFHNAFRHLINLFIFINVILLCNFGPERPTFFLNGFFKSFLDDRATIFMSHILPERSRSENHEFVISRDVEYLDVRRMVDIGSVEFGNGVSKSALVLEIV